MFSALMHLKYMITRPMTMLFFVILLPGVALAAPITKAVDINVVSVCSSTYGCVSDGPTGDKFYQNEVNAIWAQAGIEVNFVSETWLGGASNSYGANGSYWGDYFYNINDSSTNSFSNLSRLAYYDSSLPTSIFGGPSLTSITLFLVNSINASSGGTTFGEGWIGYGGYVVAMPVVASWNRIDTVAHELGHNLGLVPSSLPESDGAGHSTDRYDLMASGSTRYVPTSISQISTDGLTGKDQLPANQVAYVLANSTLVYDVVPEPSMLLLIGIGMIGMIGVRARGYGR